ncbi:MAG: hypothetical protein P1U74_04710 [Legionellaceae bacterium]|nr:hypothetical protein [Legionellaceae bacterium]
MKLRGKIVTLLQISICFILPTSLSFADAPLIKKELTFSNLNNNSIKLFDDLINKYSKNTDPLIIAWGDKLSLYHDDKTQDYPITPPNYTSLKGISHVILATFAIFDPINQFPKNIDASKNYLAELQEINNKIDKLPMTTEQRQRQKQIVHKTIVLLNRGIKEEKISKKTVKNYFKSIKALIMQNVEDAAVEKLKLISNQMAKIQQQLTIPEQQKLFVVIPVSKMPRTHYILGQYFSKYLNVPTDSPRLIFAEGITDVNEIFKLVGQWQTDNKLSYSFFNKPHKMDQDLLGDAAEEYLKHCTKDETGKLALICEESDRYPSVTDCKRTFIKSKKS